MIKFSSEIAIVNSNNTMYASMCMYMCLNTIFSEGQQDIG